MRRWVRPWLARAAAFLAATCACGLAVGTAALAGPPFLTDDPQPVDFGHFEVYTFTTSDKSNGGTFTNGPAFEFNAGIYPNVQLHVVAPFGTQAAAGMPTMSGYGDTEVGVKYRFVQETAGRPQIGVFPMAEFSTGDPLRGLGNGQTWYRLPVWIQKSYGHWTTYGGGGVALNNAAGMRNYGFGGWLVQRDLSEKLTLGGELFSQGAATVGGRGWTAYNVGGYLNVTKQFSFLFSVGHTFSGESHAVQYLGLYYTFPAVKESEPPPGS